MAKIITQSDYTRTLVRKRNDLADNIETMGVEADQTEKLNTLVPKVLDIETGGNEPVFVYAIGDLCNEYIYGIAEQLEV